MRRASMAWMVTSGQVSTVRVPSTYTSGLELPVTLSLPRSSRLGQRLYCDQLEMCSCGIAFLTASRTVRPGSAESASPVMITLPAVVGDSGLPPGSVDRSNGRDVAQPSASSGSASRTGTEWERSMAHLRVGPAAECTMVRPRRERQPPACAPVLSILCDSMHIPPHGRTTDSRYARRGGDTRPRPTTRVPPPVWIRGTRHARPQAVRCEHAAHLR